MTTAATTVTPVHAVVPLALLEAMRHLDAPAANGMDEYHQELATKRLGTSATVAAQIERYQELAARDVRVEPGEAIALLRLIGRRSDAALVFTDAGRRAAQYAVTRVSRAGRLGQRLLPRGLRNRLGFRLARRAAQRVFGLVLRREGERVGAVASHPPSADATPSGSACAFYGSAAAALLRTFTTFDGAVVHPACRALGERECRWQTASAREG